MRSAEAGMVFLGSSCWEGEGQTKPGKLAAPGRAVTLGRTALRTVSGHPSQKQLEE